MSRPFPAFRRLSPVLGAALAMTGLASAGDAYAQTKPTPAPAAQPAQPPAGPPRTETIVYDNWVVTCRDNLGKPEKRICSTSLQITNNENKQVIFLWQIGQDDAGKPVFALRTPLGVRIKEGVQLTVGAGKPRKVDFVLCDTRGCEAAAPFDDAFGRELSAASEAVAVFTLTNGKAVSLKIPIKGIDKALPALRR